MDSLTAKFAQSEDSGLSSLGLNLKSFVFQLIAFVIVLVILSRYVFPRIVRTLEERRQVLGRSLEQAKQTEETLKSAQAEASQLVTSARTQADETLAASRSQAKNIIATAEATGAEQADNIVSDGRLKLSHERQRMRQELKSELAGLVATATEKVARQKLDVQGDSQLIERAVEETAK